MGVSGRQRLGIGLIARVQVNHHAFIGAPEVDIQVVDANPDAFGLGPQGVVVWFGVVRGLDQRAGNFGVQSGLDQLGKLRLKCANNEQGQAFAGINLSIKLRSEKASLP